jgi:hypothetical protein
MKSQRNIDALYEGASATVKASIKRAMAGQIDVSEHMRRLHKERGLVRDDPPKKKPAIRMPKPQKMGSAEREYLTILEAEFPQATAILYEGLTLRLKSGCRYCADFTVWDRWRLLLICEVKGRIARNHSAARSVLAFKTAASEWPAIRFRFAAKDKTGGWNVTEINASTP